MSVLDKHKHEIVNNDYLLKFNELFKQYNFIKIKIKKNK